MKFREGDEVVIVRSVYKCNNCGEDKCDDCDEDHGLYYYEGELDEVGLKSQGRIIKVVSEKKLLLILKDGREWWSHPDELDFLNKGQLAELRRQLPGMKDIPRHPVFEVAEQTPVFLVDDKVYSLGEGTPQDGENFYEQTKGEIIKRLFTEEETTRTHLVEVGDFGFLEVLALDRAQLDLERIGEDYVKEAQRDLKILDRLVRDLDTPQLIFKQVFPYLQDGHYRKNVFELLGLEEKKDVTPSPKTKAKVTQKLEQIVDEIEIEVRDLIGRIEEAGQEHVERSKKQFELDDLFGYEEPKPYTGDSLLGRALNGRNVAIVEGTVYDLVTGNDGFKKHVQIGGQRFSLVEREEEKPKPQEFVKGAKVKIRSDSEYAGQSKNIGVMQENFSHGGNEYIKVKFKGGYLNTYRQRDLEFAEEVLERRKQSSQYLENRFLFELGKKVRVDALRQHLSRDKIIDMLRTQDAELLAMAGRKKYQGEGFGFVQNGRGNYYAYLEVPAFAIKSQFDGNHYFFDKSKVAVQVYKSGKYLKYNSEFKSVENNNHPFLHNKTESFAEICIGSQEFPTSGRTTGEIIAKRLLRCREMMMFGYTSNDYKASYRLNDNSNFRRNKKDQSELERRGILIIQGGPRQ